MRVAPLKGASKRLTCARRIRLTTTSVSSLRSDTAISLFGGKDIEVFASFSKEEPD